MLPGQVQSMITFLKTQDLEATSDFYTRVLGFRLALDQGTCRIFAGCRGAYVGFCRTDTVVNAEGIILTLVVEDVDAVCAAVEAQGAAIEVRPRFNPQYNIYQCFIRDPNGYLIEVQRFLDPRWEEQ